MSTTDVPTPGPLPDYIASNVPNPPSARAAWFKNTAPTYAGIFLWFVFWQDAAKWTTPGGTLAAGLGIALLGVVLAALVCHFLFYLVPGMLGMKTGRPLYIVGTSTFGATGGFLMPGFLMGLLQFGWLGVNTYFSSQAVAAAFPGLDPRIIMVVWGLLAAFIGLAGIQYVAKVATFLPLIPLVTLIWLTAKTIGNVDIFDGKVLTAVHRDMGVAGEPLSAVGVILALMTYIVGFFATAGAAGVDFGSSNRDEKDVHMGGFVGVALAIIVTAGLSMLIVAGVMSSPILNGEAVNRFKGAADAENLLRSTNLIPVILGDSVARWVSLALAIAAFPSACFSSLIAANSFKTTLPKVNPFISVGIGALISIGLALSGYAGNAAGVFTIIGASFGPIVGAMVVDYLIAGRRWTGPRAGFNPAGWIAWLVGFAVGITPNLHGLYPQIPAIPAAPVVAFFVGAVVYFVCMSIGLKSRVLELPTGTDARALGL
jgi:cytosine permease